MVTIKMDFYKVFSVIVFLSTQVFSENSPPALSVSEEKTKAVGSKVEFTCKASSPTEYPLLWTKIPSDDITDRNDPRNNLPDKRTDMQSDKNNTILTLKIKDIQGSDAGRYRCEILDPKATRRVVADTRLTVEQSPFIYDYSTRSVTVVVGEDAKLECYADGIPQPTVYWRRKNNDMLPGGDSTFNGHVFRISNARQQDRGTYYCVADNGVGESAQREVRFDVKFGTKVYPGHAGYGQVLGQKVELQCTIYGYPEVSVFWLKEGKPIILGNNSRISNSQTADAKLSSVLTIDAVMESDYGEYTCKAKNSYGSDEQRIKLYDTTKIGTTDYFDISDGNWNSPAQKLLLLSMIFLITTRFLTCG